MLWDSKLTDASNTVTLAATMFILFVSGAAQAIEINVTRMDFYPPGSTSPAHVNTTVNGQIDFTAQTGTFNSGTTAFFGFPWSATVVEAWEAPGTYSFAGTSPQGAYSYAFTLGAGQYAAGLMFQWSSNNGIPVLAVFDCVAATSSLIPLDTDGGAPGTAMQTPPFPSQTAAFSGSLASGTCSGVSVSDPSIVNDGGATLTPGSTDPTGDGAVTLSQLISAGIPIDDDVVQQCVGGCFDFQISGLTGTTAEVVLPLSAPVPAAAVYRKWNGSAWEQFSTDAGNALASAAALPAGGCPTSGYSSGLNQGHECIKLTIVDGGANDLDGEANGTIVDPGGVAERDVPAAATSLDSGCTLGSSTLTERLDWLLLGAALMALGILRRGNAQS